MTEFERDLKKYYRYISYLMGTSFYDLPENLPSPLNVVERRSLGEECDEEASELWKLYFSFMDRPKIVSLIGAKKVKTMFLNSYAVAALPSSQQELNGLIDQLESMFQITLGFHEFEEPECKKNNDLEQMRYNDVIKKLGL